MRISDKYTSTSFNADDLEQAKLKLKNECPKVLSRFVAHLADYSKTSARNIFGLKPKVPLAVAALAELDGNSAFDSKVSAWQKANSFVNTSLQTSSRAATPPAPTRTPSSSSQSSRKSVAFSETNSVATFFKEAVPTDIIREA